MRKIVPFIMVMMVLTLFPYWAKAAVSEEEFLSTTEAIVNAFSSEDSVDGKVAALEELVPQALPILEEGIKLHPENSNAYYALFFCYSFEEDEKLALEAIEQAYTLDPENVIYRFYYAFSLKVNWRPLEAREHFTAISAKYEDHYSLRQYVTAIDMAIQDYAAAEEYYLSILGTGDEMTESGILSDLGFIMLQRGEHMKAIEFLKSSIELAPDNVIALTRLGEALLKSHQAEESLAYFDEALLYNYKYVEALYFKGVALESLGRVSEAQELYNDAYLQGMDNLSISDDDGREHYIMGQIYKKLGMNELAESALTNAQVLYYTYEAPYAEVQ